LDFLGFLFLKTYKTKVFLQPLSTALAASDSFRYCRPIGREKRGLWPASMHSSKAW